MNITLKYLSAFALSLGLFACSSSSDDSGPMPTPTPTPPADPATIFDVAEGDDRFSILVTALQTAGLETTLRDPESEFTVFAPTNEAFENLLDVLETDAQGLLANPNLSEILLYHVLRGSVDATAAFGVADSDESTVPTANTNQDLLALSRSGESLLVNLSTVIDPNLEATNGVIHAIDTVLMPPAPRGEPTLNIVETAQADDRFTMLVDAVIRADLVSDLSNPEATLTVFAPTNDAFEALGENNIAALFEFPETLAAILTQHVLGSEVNSIGAYALNGSNALTLSGAEIGVSIADGKLYFGGAEVIIEDIYTTNGIIHVIDTVVVGDVQLPKPAESIVEVAQAAEDEFTILEKALGAADLVGDLSNLNRNFTVFAPTDAAFEAYLAEEGLTEEELLAAPGLADVLLYHVIEGPDVLASAAVSVAKSDESLVPMLGGGHVALSHNNETLYINLSTVVTPNVLAANGVIHVIDKVLVPPAEMGEPVDNIIQTAIAAGSFGTLYDFLMQANLIDTLSNEEATFTVFAPTDDAFAALGGAADNLTTEQLRQVLLHHVIPERAVDSITAYSLNGTSVPTAAPGLSVSLEIVDGMLQVEDSNIVMYDIYTTNGIIHVIDTVITSSLED